MRAEHVTQGPSFGGLTNPATFCTLFDTVIARCGIAWCGVNVCVVAFPGRDDNATITAMQRRRGDLSFKEPPREIRDAIALIQAPLSGETVEFGPITLDLDGTTAFERDVYTQTQKIRRGETTTYGEIARALGSNPVPIIVPCHRVLAAGGKTGGFSGTGGVETKPQLLRIEGAIAL